MSELRRDRQFNGVKLDVDFRGERSAQRVRFDETARTFCAGMMDVTGAITIVYRSLVRDPVEEFVHDHADLSSRVRVLGAAMTTEDPHVVETQLRDLREDLFWHFAREEEGLFPFVANALPELADPVADMAIAHDAICGALARMCHAAAAGAERVTIAPMFERFERSYSEHAESERSLFSSITGRLDAEQRRRLAAIVGGL